MCARLYYMPWNIYYGKAVNLSDTREQNAYYNTYNSENTHTDTYRIYLYYVFAFIDAISITNKPYSSMIIISIIVKTSTAEKEISFSAKQRFFPHFVLAVVVRHDKKGKTIWKIRMFFFFVAEHTILYACDPKSQVAIQTMWNVIVGGFFLFTANAIKYDENSNIFVWFGNGISRCYFFFCLLFSMNFNTIGQSQLAVVLPALWFYIFFANIQNMLFFSFQNTVFRFLITGDYNFPSFQLL